MVSSRPSRRRLRRLVARIRYRRRRRRRARLHPRRPPLSSSNTKSNVPCKTQSTRSGRTRRSAGRVVVFHSQSTNKSSSTSRKTLMLPMIPMIRARKKTTRRRSAEAHVFRATEQRPQEETFWRQNDKEREEKESFLEVGLNTLNNFRASHFSR